MSPASVPARFASVPARRTWRGPHGLPAVMWVVCLSLLVLTTGACTSPVAARQSDTGLRTVVWSAPEDPYAALAREIAGAEDLPLAGTLDDALALDPAVLLWVVSPGQLSEEVFAEYGAALRRHGKAVSVGLISGSTVDRARALWQRRPEDTGGHGGDSRRASIVPREGRFDVWEGGALTHHPLTIRELAAQIERAGYVMYQGHGTRRSWRLDEAIEWTAADLPLLPPQVVAAGACQTFKPGSEGSIALAFTDRGAAAYVGFLHSPTGYLMGDPKGFPFQYTWPNFPIGHVVQVQNRGLQRGFLAWPFYLLLGDPRLALQAGPPYRVQDDRRVGDKRELSLSGAPPGVIPVRVPGGAGYRFVEVPRVGRAGQGDRFYNARIQMADLGADKFLLVQHLGGPLTIRLSPKPPGGWPLLRTVTDALDHVTVIQHSEGNRNAGWIAGGLLLAALVWVTWRNRPALARALPRAVAVGLLLTALRGGYALARRAYLASLYAQWLRTMDPAFEIAPWFLVQTCWMATGGTWWFLSARSRWGRMLSLPAILFPTWFVAAFWFGVVALTNALARQQVGLPLYKYGGGWMPLIAGLVEGVPVALALWGAQRLGPAGIFREESR